jgi:hypothetical protein
LGSNLELPDSNLELPDSNFELPDSNLELPDSNLELPDSNLELPDSNLELPDSNLELPDSNFELPDSNLELPDSNFELPDSNLELPSGPGYRSEEKTRTEGLPGLLRQFRGALCGIDVVVRCSFMPSGMSNMLSGTKKSPLDLPWGSLCRGLKICVREFLFPKPGIVAYVKKNNRLRARGYAAPCVCVCVCVCTAARVSGGANRKRHKELQRQALQAYCRNDFGSRRKILKRGCAS